MLRTAKRFCFELLEKRVVLDGAEARFLFDSPEFTEGNYALKLDAIDRLHSEDGEPVVVGGQHVTKKINGFSVVGANFKDDSFQLLLKKGSRNYTLNSSKELFFSDFFHSIDFEESILLDEDYRFSSMGSRKENLLGLFSSNSNEIYVQRNENKSFTELYSLSFFREMSNGDFYGINIEPVRYWTGSFVTASLMNPAVYEIVVEDSVLSFQ